jgi:hypothetical protein
VLELLGLFFAAGWDLFELALLEDLFVVSALGQLWFRFRFNIALHITGLVVLQTFRT